MSAISFDKAFGNHDDALLLFERRTQLLSENIANSDTPGYKARDIDFNQVLQGVKTSLPLETTSAMHINPVARAPRGPIEYRVPTQSSADGNTVDMQQEQAAFAQNTIRYQTSLMILSRRISGLINAFKGE